LLSPHSIVQRPTNIVVVLWFYLKVDSFFVFLLHKLGWCLAFVSFPRGRVLSLCRIQVGSVS
jgi:hypothetical protein